MTISTARFERFTVFSDARFEFCPGVNILIGENGTGKSHVLKGAYALCEGYRSLQRPDADKGLKASVASSAIPARPEQSPAWTKVADGMTEAGVRSLGEFVQQVYLPDSIGNLIQRGSDRLARVSLGFSTQDQVWVQIERQPPLDTLAVSLAPEIPVPRALFLPPREVLSIYPGFVSAWLQRQSSFDRTYFDLCVALGERPLRRIPQVVAGLLAPLQELIGGPVVLKGDHFFIGLPDGDMEVPLFAEGLRKIATIIQLFLNGSLAPGSSLFWDEPEANMNPRLVVLLRSLLLGLAQAGVQVFVATHDFLLTSELSLASRYEGKRDLVRFFALSRGGAGVTVDTADDLDGLQSNPIVAEFGAHYDREARLFARRDGASE